MQSISPRVYISILNWNNWADTAKCLNSLLNLEYENARILVVDNNSADQSVRCIQKAFPDIDIITSDVNRGYAGGHSLALVRAMSDSAELFWMLNNDLTVRSDALTALVNAYLRVGDGLYGGVALKASDESRIGPCAGWEISLDGKPDFTRYNRLTGKKYSDVFSHTEERIVANVYGSSLMVPTAVIKKHGFMDESFFLYGEETDYCLRLGKKGIPSVLVPSSIVIHEGRGSLEAKPELEAVIEYYMKRNWLVLVKRHRGVFKYLRVMLRELLSCFAIWADNHLPKTKTSQERTAFRYQCLAVFDALRNRRGKALSPEDFVL